MAFNKLMQAIGVQDHWINVQLMSPPEEELWVQHAVQSIVWRLTGVHQSLHRRKTESIQRMRQTRNNRGESDHGFHSAWNIG